MCYIDLEPFARKLVMPKNKPINLLPQEEFNASTTGRVLKWATGTFRIIVIATEMVVMGAFLSRFWLDAQNSNLNNTIKIKSAQISAQSETEKTFRSIQTKLNVVSQIKNNQKTSDYLDKIVSSVPTNITLSRVSVSSASIQVQGVSIVDTDILQFIANLKGDLFKEVELGQVGSSEVNPGETNFTINIKY